MENNQIKYIVYCTINKINNKIYIGCHKTSKPQGWDFYLGGGCYSNAPSTYQHAKTHFQRAIKKYGVNSFHRKTIAVFDNEEDAYLLEEELVNEEFLSRDDVYNTVLGGNHSTAIKTYQYDVNGNFIAEHYSIKDASRMVNRSFRSIWRAINEKIKCANFFWTTVYSETLDLTHYKTTEADKGIPVFQYSHLGEYECCYDSISETARINNLNKSNLQTAIKLGYLCENKYYTTVYAPNFSIAKTEKIKYTEVHQYDLEGNYIQSFESARKANITLNFTSNIYNAIKLGHTAGGFQWRQEKLPKIIPVPPKSGRIRKIGQYDQDWNLIKVFDTLTECKKEVGSAVHHVLRGRNEFHGNLRYKYIG